MDVFDIVKKRAQFIPTTFLCVLCMSTMICTLLLLFLLSISIPDLVRLVSDMDEWLALDSENIAAVHCRGGKGRTGSAVVAYLMYSRAVDSADEGLDVFAMRRTNTRKRGKLQGVETPSQVQQLKRFEQLLATQGCYRGTTHDMKILRSPNKRSVRLTSLTSDELYPAHMNGAGVRLQVEIRSESVPGGVITCPAVRISGQRWSLPIEEISVTGDVRVKIAAWEADKGQQLHLDGASCSDEAAKDIMAFSFHTAFLTHEHDSGTVTADGGLRSGAFVLPLGEIDIACKNKGGQFNRRGCLSLHFTWL